METALYRHFDKDGRLLYVGISLNAVARLAQHRGVAHWFRSIARIEIEWHPTREDACAAEIEAIREELPMHNVIHAWSPELAALLDGHPLRHMVGRNGSLLPEFESLTQIDADELADRL